MKALMLTIAVCVGLLLAGCGGDDSSSEATESGGATTDQSASTDQSATTEQPEPSPVEVSTDPDDANAEGAEPDPDTGKRPKPVIEAPDDPPPDELVVTDIEEGDGAEVKDGEEIFVDYVGVFYKDGKEFESSWAGKAQEAFVKGGGILIDGWEQGVEGMKVGGRRELIVPSELAYKTGVLIYVVDLLKVAPPRGSTGSAGGGGSSAGGAGSPGQ
jgi:peptidylprolyl isomerase